MALSFAVTSVLTLRFGLGVWREPRRRSVGNGLQHHGLRESGCICKMESMLIGVDLELASEPWVDARARRIQTAENVLAGRHQRIEVVAGIGELVEELRDDGQAAGRKRGELKRPGQGGQPVLNLGCAELVTEREEFIYNVRAATMGHQLVGEQPPVERDALARLVDVALDQGKLLRVGHDPRAESVVH